MLRAAISAWLLLLAAAAPAAAPAPDRTARILAGLDRPAAGELPLAGAALERHANLTQHWWNHYDRRIGMPLRTWAATEIPVLPGATLFYPFSGPDFPTVQQLFPDASRYVLVALQRAGTPPALARATAADLGAFVERFDGGWRHFAQIGFFRTLDLDEDDRRPGMRVGITSVLMAFAARLGYEVVAVRPVRVNADGTDLEAHPGDRTREATWESVRIDLARNGRVVHLDYVRANLADAALTARPAIRAWIERMAEHAVVLKAASHLLQRPTFTILRDAILARSAGVVQDETGIDYERLAQVFAVTLYGRFTRPHHLFHSEAQRSLAEAYAAARDSRPLPFRISYQHAEGANLQVAWRRRPRRRPARLRVPGRVRCGWR